MENCKKSPLRVRSRVKARRRGWESSSGEGSARKFRGRDCANSVWELDGREIGGLPRTAGGIPTNAPVKFCNIHLQVQNSELIEVSQSQFLTPSAFIFQDYENDLNILE